MKFLLRTLLVLAPMALSAQTVVGTAHDLTTKVGNVDGQVCIFCHAPHNAVQTNGPLWNHATTSPLPTYTTYRNTAGVLAGQPGAGSLACLSCHDGTMAVGSILQNGGRTATWTNPALAGFDATGKMVSPNVNLVGTDLSNDHPVGVALPVNSGYKLASAVTAAGVTGGLRLFTASNNVECASCHAVHDNTTAPPFLRKVNSGSALCVTCHNK